MKMKPNKTMLPDIRDILRQVSHRRRAQQSADEMARIMNLVYARQPKVMMEIGSFRGWNLWALSRMILNPAQLISIEPLIGLPSDEHDKWSKGEVAARLAPHELRWFKEDSNSPDTVRMLEEFLQGSKIDFLFIDGNHSYEYVKNDYLMYRHLVKGFIAFHDTGPRPAKNKTCQVRSFWQELIKDHDGFEVLDDSPKESYGIGVISV